MKTRKNNGILVNGSIRAAGVTFFTRKGQTIVRASKSNQPLRRTKKQFIARQKRMLCNLYWGVMKTACRKLHLMGDDPYRAFCAMAAKLPPLYLTRDEFTSGRTFLMPGIPVSCGTLPDIGLALGSVGGRPALLTDLAPAALGDDRLLLVSLRQYVIAGNYHLGLKVRKVTVDECVVEGGCLALVGDDYGDTMYGWALVRRRGPHCSTQRVVTACSLHLPYLTDEAFLRAAASFGGLTPSP